MKILAIGDFHGKLPQKLVKIAKQSDLVLCTGDFGGNDEITKIIFKYFTPNWPDIIGKKKARKLVKADYSSGIRTIDALNRLGVPIYTVFGNWDFNDGDGEELGLKLKSYKRLIHEKKNIIYIPRIVKKARGLKIYGFGGMVTAHAFLTKDSGFEKKRIARYTKHYREELKQLFRHKDKDIDFLLVHYPPYRYFDVVKSKIKTNPMNGKHVGFDGYNKYIMKYTPKVFICGHMHEYQGVKKLGRTIIIATGAAHEGKAALIDYGKKITVKLIR